MTLEYIHDEMVKAMKSGDKLRKEVLASVIDNAKKAATAGKQRTEIDENAVSAALMKERKVIQEQISTCPDTEQYRDRMIAYCTKLSIIDEYAPKIITDVNEIKDLIYQIWTENDVNEKNAKKVVMPLLKGKCDMRLAQIALKEVVEEMNE